MKIIISEELVNVIGLKVWFFLYILLLFIIFVLLFIEIKLRLWLCFLNKNKLLMY